jgi:hypothetical protein
MERREGILGREENGGAGHRLPEIGIVDSSSFVHAR